MSTTDNKQSSGSFVIRPCTNNDEEGALSVCLQTGNSGNDATLLFNDPKVLGYRYVSPYIHLSPELAFVLKDLEGNVCGYVLAVVNSDLFYKQYVNEWLPKMKQMYPIIPSGKRKYLILFSYFLLGEERMKRDWEAIEGFHNDTLESFKLFDDYPSHLHIDILPKAQGWQIYLSKTDLYSF